MTQEKGGANTRQIAGGHYVKYGDFQVWDAWWYWGMDPFQANIIKYVMRVKGDVNKRLEDLDKAEHYLEKYRELLTEQLKEQEEQFERANASSWKLTTLQETIVRGVSFHHLREQLRELARVVDLMQAYKQQLLEEQKDDKEI